MWWVVQRDWRDDRIAELEAELARKDAIIAEQGRRIAALEEQVAELLEQLGQNSRNSHKPPSTDTPEERQKRKNREKKARKERKRGGQPGHHGKSRELVPPEKVSKFVELFPAGGCQIFCVRRGGGLVSAEIVLRNKSRIAPWHGSTAGTAGARPFRHCGVRGRAASTRRRRMACVLASSSLFVVVD
jgi:hypothetical protein